MKTLSAANGSTETEIRALAATLDELDAQCKAQDEEITIADEAHSATLAVSSVVVDRGYRALRVCSLCVGLAAVPPVAHTGTQRRGIRRYCFRDTQAIQSRKDKRENLEKRLAIAGTSLEQCKTQMAEVQAVTEEKECAWKGIQYIHVCASVLEYTFSAPHVKSAMFYEPLPVSDALGDNVFATFSAFYFKFFSCTTLREQAAAE